MIRFARQELRALKAAIAAERRWYLAAFREAAAELARHGDASRLCAMLDLRIRAIEQAGREEPAPMADAAIAALRQALPVMREDLRVLVEIEADLDHRAPEGYRCRIKPLDAEALRMAQPVLAAIRSAEAVAGRVPDDQPAWLNDIIDGRRPL